MLINSTTREEDLRLDTLTRDPNLQVRSVARQGDLQVRGDTVHEYKELLADGVDMGLLEVIEEITPGSGLPLEQCPRTGRWLLADGFHRSEAMLGLGWQTARCRVRLGTWTTAILVACQANGGRGLAYSHADKLKVAEQMLRALGEEGLTWPDTKIAQWCGLYRGTVAKVRADLSSRFHIPTARQIERRDGINFTWNPGASGGARVPRYTPDDELDTLPDAEVMPARPAPVPRPTSRSTTAGHMAPQRSGGASNGQSTWHGFGGPMDEPGDRVDEVEARAQPTAAVALTAAAAVVASDGIAYTLTWSWIGPGGVPETGQVDAATIRSLPDAVWNRVLHDRGDVP